MSSDPLAHVAELPGVAEAVSETRDAVDRLLRHRMLRGPRSAVSRLSAESALRGARASAALEGEDIPLERLRGGPAAPPDAPVLHGALRVNGALAGLAETWHRAPRQVLARMHALAAAGIAGPDRLGRPRSGPPGPVPGYGPPGPVPGSPRSGASGPMPTSPGPEPGQTGPAPASSITGSGPGAPEPRSGPPAPEPWSGLPAPEPGEVAARVGLLAELLTSAAEPPALVLAAVVHGELLVLRPFGVADGLIARAAQRLTLMTRGLDPKGLTMPEVGHLELRTGYGEALRGYADATPDGVAGWIRHCAAAISLGARESVAVCEAWQRGAA